MAKEKAVYNPGELSQIRNRLGDFDHNEAKRMAKLLGGEVGVEKSPAPKAPPKAAPRNAPIARKPPRQEKAGVSIDGKGTGLPPSRPRPVSPPAPGGNADVLKSSAGEKRGRNEPLMPIRVKYWERVKMDRCCAQPQFDIKTTGQALLSMFSLFNTPPDLVNHTFVTKRLGEYYQRLETLVTATRMMLPQSNIRRLEILRKKAPFANAVLTTIRSWDIGTIAEKLADIQAKPRTARIERFADILRIMYRPLFILEQLDTETHIKGAYKILYKLLCLEESPGAKDKNQELIRTALVAYTTVRRDIHYFLYPLLMKLISDRWFSYENFFKQRKIVFLNFIGASDADRLVPPPNNAGLDDNIDLQAAEEEEENPAEERDENDPAAISRKAEKKAVTRGLETLETLFPQAGWNRITEFPDLYPYFGKMFDLSRGYEQISPQDPLHQTIVLARILEELFFGLRYVSFTADAPGLNEADGRLNEAMAEIINNWHSHLEHTYYKEYLPRVREYVRILEGSVEARSSTYAKRLLNELHWTKRLFFLPYYKFESFFPPPFQKKEITPLYPEIRRLRKLLTAVAMGLEQGMKQGGADKRVRCPGINNPWDSYEFQVPNPLSQRLNVLLSGKTKNNASLIFFTLAVATVMDYLVNNEESWIYGNDRPAPLFRGIGAGKGGSDEDHVDADALFHASVQDQRAAVAKAEEEFVPEPLPAEDPAATAAPASDPATLPAALVGAMPSARQTASPTPESSAKPPARPPTGPTPEPVALPSATPAEQEESLEPDIPDEEPVEVVAPRRKK